MSAGCARLNPVSALDLGVEIPFAGEILEQGMELWCLLASSQHLGTAPQSAFMGSAVLLGTGKSQGLIP